MKCVILTINKLCLQGILQTKTCSYKNSVTLLFKITLVQEACFAVGVSDMGTHIFP